jgi:GNAT superfamily N-acetyltransferase
LKTGFFRLTEEDRPALAQHLLRLDAADRRLRFFHPADDAQILRFVGSLEMGQLCGYFLLGQLVASATVMPDAQHTVEFSVTVDQPLRGQGIATELLDYGIETADEDADLLVIHHLVENRAMAGVHRKLPSTRQLGYGEVDVVIDLKALRQERQKALGLLCGAED